MEGVKCFSMRPPVPQERACIAQLWQENQEACQALMEIRARLDATYLEMQRARPDIERYLALERQYNLVHLEWDGCFRRFMECNKSFREHMRRLNETLGDPLSEGVNASA